MTDRPNVYLTIPDGSDKWKVCRGNGINPVLKTLEPNTTVITIEEHSVKREAWNQTRTIAKKEVQKLIF